MFFTILIRKREYKNPAVLLDARQRKHHYTKKLKNSPEVEAWLQSYSTIQLTERAKMLLGVVGRGEGWRRQKNEKIAL